MSNIYRDVTLNQVSEQDIGKTIRVAGNCPFTGWDDLLWNDECGNAGIYFAVSDHSCGGRCRSTGSPAV